MDIKKEKKVRVVWTEEEIVVFLNLLKEKKVLKILDGKRFKAAEVFKALAKEMAEKGFFKEPEGMKIKLKNLKAEYYKTKRQNNKSGEDPKTCPFYDELDDLLGNRPAIAMDGIDTAESQEGEDDSQEEFDEQGEVEVMIVEEDGVLRTETVSMSEELDGAFPPGVQLTSKDQPKGNPAITTPPRSRSSTPSRATITLNDVKSSIEESLRKIACSQDNEDRLLKQIFENQAKLFKQITTDFFKGLSSILRKHKKHKRKASSSSSPDSSSESDDGWQTEKKKRKHF